MLKQPRLLFWSVLGAAVVGGSWVAVSPSAQQGLAGLREDYWPPAARAKALRLQREAEADTLFQETMTLRHAAASDEWRGDFKAAYQTLSQAKERQDSLLQKYPETPAIVRLAAATKGNAPIDSKLAVLGNLREANELWQWLWLVALRNQDLSQGRLALEISRGLKPPPPTDEDQQCRTRAEGLGAEGRLADALAEALKIKGHSLRYSTLLDLAVTAAQAKDVETASQMLAAAWQESSGGLAVVDPVGDIATRMAVWPAGTGGIQLHLQTILGNAAPAPLQAELLRRVLVFRHRLNRPGTAELLKECWKNLDSDLQFQTALDIEELGLAVRAATTARQARAILEKAGGDKMLATVEESLKQRIDERRHPEEAPLLLQWFVGGLLDQNRAEAAQRLADAYPFAVSGPSRGLILARWLGEGRQDLLVASYLRAAGAEEQTVYLEAFAKMLAGSPESLGQLRQLHREVAEPAAKDRLAGLLVSESLRQGEPDQALAALAGMTTPAEKEKATLEIARHYANDGAFLKVRQMIRDGAPEYGNQLWQILAIGNARAGSVAEAIRIVDEQLAEAPQRQETLAGIIRELVAARRHAAAILLLDRVSEPALKIRLSYQIEAGLYQDPETPDYRKIREIETAQPLEARIAVLRSQWKTLAPVLRTDPQQLGNPETAAWLHFILQSFSENPAQWLAAIGQVDAGALPFEEWDAALEATGRQEGLSQLRGTLWRLGTPAMRQTLLPQRLAGEPLERLLTDLAALQDPLERVALATLACDTSLVNRKYENALELLAVQPIGEGRWWWQLEQIATGMSRDNVEMSEPMKKRLRELRGLWQATAETRLPRSSRLEGPRTTALPAVWR